MEFAGLTDQDFEAWHPSRATSKAFNRPRLEAQQKALGLARSLHERAAAAQTQLELRASDPSPSLWNKNSVTAQWVFLWRDAAARRKLEDVLDRGKTLAATLTDPTPYFRHAFLALHLDVEKVEVGLFLHGDAWADVRNLRGVFQTEGRRDALLAALRALPDGFAVGVTGVAAHATSGLDMPALVSSVEAITESSQWWFVSRTIARADAVARGGALGDELRAAFDAVLPLYRTLAWSHDNDLVSLESEIEAARAEREAHVQERADREADWQSHHDAEIERRREQAQVEARERQAAAERARPAVVKEAVQHVAQEVRPERPPRAERHEPRPERHEPRPERHEPRAKPAEAPRKVEAPKAAKPEAPTPSKPPAEGRNPLIGLRMKVKRGTLVGMVGTVTEVDARGAMKLSFGLFSARVEKDDASPAEA